MVKKLIFILGLLFCYWTASSQKMVVMSMEMNDRSIEARTNPKYDKNGNVCALLKVQIALQHVKFEGNVIDVLDKTGEYWVYLTEGTKKITVKRVGYLPLEVDFTDYGIKSLQKETVYVMVVETNVEKVVESADVNFRVKPKDSKLLVDGYECPLKNGSFIIKKPVGSTLKYVALAPKHILQEGTFFVSSSSDQNVVLELEKRRSQVDSRFFTLFESGFSSAPQGSMGFSIGGVKRVGGYFKFMGWGLKSVKERALHSDLANYYFLNGEHKKKFVSVSGGMLFRLGCPLHLMVGAGFGKREVMYQTYNEEWIADDSTYVRGVSLDLGGLLFIKGFSLHLGMSSIKFKYNGVEIGVGFNL